MKEKFKNKKNYFLLQKMKSTVGHTIADISGSLTGCRKESCSKGLLSHLCYPASWSSGLPSIGGLVFAFSISSTCFTNSETFKSV